MSIGWVENRGGQVSGVKKFHHQPQKYFRSQQQPFQNQKVWPRLDSRRLRVAEWLKLILGWRPPNIVILLQIQSPASFKNITLASAIEIFTAFWFVGVFLKLAIVCCWVENEYWLG